MAEPDKGDRTQPKPEPYPAEKARGGEIILRARWQRLVFAGALILCVVLALVFRFMTGGW